MPARESRRHAGVRPSSNRRAAWLAGLISLPVMVIVAFFLVEALGPQRAQTTTSAGADPAARRCAATVTAGSVPCAQPLVAASTVSPSAPAASTSPPASAVPSASPAATRAPSPPTHPAAPAGRAAAGPAGGQQGVPAGQVLAVINQARAAAGLPAYPISSGLDLSATRHNTVMASGCGLSHQCAGEAALGARETAAGVTWTSAGENIGEGGPVSAATTAIAQMAVTLTRDMLAEKPPDDGHRLNILSSAFHHIGIAVYRDSTGTVWMTQDFSN
jgi:uncharacterized protein YkwD